MITIHLIKRYMALLAAVLFTLAINPGYAQESELVISISPEKVYHEPKTEEELRLSRDYPYKKDDVHLYVFNQNTSGKLYMSIYMDLNGNAILDGADRKIREMILEDESDKDLYPNNMHIIKYSLNELAYAQLEPGDYFVVPTDDTELSTHLQILPFEPPGFVERMVIVRAYESSWPNSRGVDVAYSHLKTAFEQGKINKQGLVQALLEGRKGHESILPQLEGFWYESEYYAAAAAKMLAELKYAGAIEPLLKTGFDGFGGYYAKNVAISLCANGLVKNFIAIVENPNKERGVRINAMDVLSGFQEPEVGVALLHALDDSDADIRAKAAKTLGDRQDSVAVQPLLKSLEDKEQNVRAAAAVALGKISEPKSFGCLVDNLNHSRAEVRSASAQAIIAIGNHEWVTYYATQIIKFLESEPSLNGGAFPGIYVDLAILVAKTKDQRVGKYLVEAIGKTSSNKQRLIAQALDELESQLSATKK